MSKAVHQQKTSLVGQKNTNLIDLDEVQLYLAKGAKLHPLLKTAFISKLYELKAQGKISLTPSMILNLFHLRLKNTKL